MDIYSTYPLFPQVAQALCVCFFYYTYIHTYIQSTLSKPDIFGTTFGVCLREESALEIVLS